MINGISRSGSNLLWNIMQSHPDVCSPIGENNRVLHPRSKLLKKITRFMYLRLPTGLVGPVIDRKLYAGKLRNLEHDDNRWKTETTLYSREEIKSAVLCTKSLNEEIYLTQKFYAIYDQVYSLGLTRNGYALCEGKVRRGLSPGKAGKFYARYMEKIISDSEKLGNYKLVKFEDMIQDPFTTAEELYRFCDLSPTTCNELKLKSKKIVSDREKHFDKYTDIGTKYWFDRSSVHEFIDQNVNQAQEQLLSEQDRKRFEKYAKPALEYLLYSPG